MNGFTLMELMVAVVIVGIFSSIALPSFMSTIRKSRRPDAIQSLRALQLAQERWRGNHAAYATLAQLGVNATSPGGRYTLAVLTPSALGYTATASAIAGSSQVSDSANGVSCAVLSVNQDSPVFSPAGQAACWGR